MLTLRSVYSARFVALRAAAVAITGFAFTLAFGTAPASAQMISYLERAELEAKEQAMPRSIYRSAAAKPFQTANKAGRKKLGGHAAATEPKRPKAKGVKVAALGNTYYQTEVKKPTVTGAGVRWAASGGCLDAGLKSLIYLVAANYGPVTVNSTCRSRGHNRAVGGARRSKHLTGDAVDFRVRGNARAVYAYLRSASGVGGFKHYGGGLFHIDNGPRRTW